MRAELRMDLAHDLLADDAEPRLGTGEQFHRDVGEPATAADASRPADFARLRAVAAESPSIEILGPPPFATASVGGAAH